MKYLKNCLKIIYKCYNFIYLKKKFLFFMILYNNIKYYEAIIRQMDSVKLLPKATEINIYSKNIFFIVSDL